MSLDSASDPIRSTYGATSSVSTFLQLIGGWAKPSGRGIWMLRSLTIGFATAAVVGVTCATASGVLFGAGAQAFVVGSSIGFAAGSISNYYTNLAEAMLSLQDHPKLMRHHLESNIPWYGYRGMDVVSMRKDGVLVPFFNAHWVRRSHLVAAHQTALPSLIEIETKREKAILEEEGT